MIPQRNRQIGLNRLGFWLPGLFLIMGLGVSGCAHRPPADANGNLPDDVVRNFLTLVQAEDYQAARGLWYGESKLVFQPSNPKGKKVDLRTKFKDFCAQYRQIDLENVRISKARRGKSGFSMVDVDWQEGGEQKHDQFGLKIIDGEWKIERGYYW